MDHPLRQANYLPFLLPFFLLGLMTPGTVLSDVAGKPPPPTKGAQESQSMATPDPRLALILQKMDSVYGKLNTFEAEFRQESEAKALKRRKESSGRIYFKKPDRMRWSYVEPELRDIYLTGKQMTVFTPSRNTVVLQSLNDALGTTAPAELFMGPAALSETFEISLAGAEYALEDSTCLRLVPIEKRGMTVEEILLWVGSSNYLPMRTESRDILGNVTRIQFLKPKPNGTLSKGIFDFKLPPDAEVVENKF